MMMEVEQVAVGEEHEADNDAFLAFVEYARSVILPDGEDEEGIAGDGDSNTRGSVESSQGPGWSWVVSRILKTCVSYSSGVTPAILLSELSQAWSEQRRSGALKKRRFDQSREKKHRRTKLPSTVTIDSIFEKKFLSLNSVLEAFIINVFVLPGTNIFMLTLGDSWSSNTIELYLHHRYYNLVDSVNGILKKDREIFLTGCYLRTATVGPGSGQPRLLPTEYLLILLDEDQDDDAMLLGAQFCSDSFSSISLDAVSKGASYSLYARIESIGSLEIQGNLGSLQRQQIILIDNDGVKLKFLLWGEQVLLARLFSIGSMLALDRPFIANSLDGAVEACGELCLEYGSVTQLYLVPFVQHEEHVCVALTQNRCQGSRLLAALDPTQVSKVSQLTLLRDSQGSIDFSNYPFQSFVVDLHDKMTGISLYGVVTDIFKDKNTEEFIFSLRIEDPSGVIWAKLHFTKSWSLGRLGLGYTVLISGLTCVMTKQKRLEVLWFEKDAGASIISISSLPALLNSSCLHKLSCLSDLSSQTRRTHVCRVWLDQIEHCHVNTRFSHVPCGNFVNNAPCGLLECSFCNDDCNAADIVRTFHLKITLADHKAKVFAWCTGSTATELLQISPDEFYELSEEEQVMYPSSLESERFMVALVNCRRQGDERSMDPGLEDDEVTWEITRAHKSE